MRKRLRFQFQLFAHFGLKFFRNAHIRHFGGAFICSRDIDGQHAQPN